MPIETLADASELSALFDDWLAESGISAEEDYGIRVDKEIETRNFQLFCDGSNSDVLVSRDGNEITGFFVMIYAPSVVGPDLVAAEHFFYVRPKWRGVVGLRLIRAGEQWAKDRGCTHLMSTSSRLAGKLFGKVCKLYGRLGMKFIEAGYIKKL